MILKYQTRNTQYIAGLIGKKTLPGYVDTNILV